MTTQEATQEELEKKLATFEESQVKGAETARALGALATLRGDFDKALTYYERATALNPNDVAAREGVTRTKKFIAGASST